MANARQMIALLKSHVQRDDQEFLSIAMELAANEARQGHGQVATTIKQLIDQVKSRSITQPKPVLVVSNRSELDSLLLTTDADVKLSDMSLPSTLFARLQRIVLEHRQQTKLREHGLSRVAKSC